MPVEGESGRERKNGEIRRGQSAAGA